MNSQDPRARIWSGRSVKPRGEALRVMVVDDNKDAADALTAYLSLENFNIQTAYGGRQAVNIAASWLPHLIVMDISMPECNGFDAALELRADLRTRDIAIIAFTALDEGEVRRHLTDHEFDGYCQKGQPPSRLVALLSQLAN
jgi:two-component system OmpR family response regulator